MLLVVCSHEFANGNAHLYSIHERDRFRPLRVSQESIGMVLCTGLVGHSMNCIGYGNLNSVCLCDCLSICMSMWNRLPNHAHYGDESFAGDSLGLGLGQRINFI